MTSIERELALLIKAEEDARPDLEAASDSFKRVNEDLGGQIEPGLQLGPESKVDMSQTVPLVVDHLGKNFDREMEKASSNDFAFQADQQGILERVWISGKEVHRATA